MDSEPQSKASSYVKTFFATLCACLLFALCILAPYSFWWLHSSGDAAVERAVAAQARGDFAIFGSALSQDFVDYKLRLYAATQPQIIAIGSSRVMQFRGAWFDRPFLNMGGVAGNLGILRSTIDALLEIRAPQAVIIGLDFWWFMPQWENNPCEYIPPTSGTYNYGLENLKKPYIWLLEGKITPVELLTPFFGLFGRGFKTDRYGIMAQKTSDGFGPDGSWYYTAETTGQKPPYDFQFADTLGQISRGIKAFYHAPPGQLGPDPAHIDAFAEIWRTLKKRNIATYIFIAPLAPEVFSMMKKMSGQYPHLFQLQAALRQKGIEAMDFTDPDILTSSHCEFIDGFHGGEVTYARILRQMSEHWPSLAAYVDKKKLDALIGAWHDHAQIYDARLRMPHETDFMRFACPKTKSPTGMNDDES